MESDSQPLDYPKSAKYRFVGRFVELEESLRQPTTLTRAKSGQLRHGSATHTVEEMGNLGVGLRIRPRWSAGDAYNAGSFVGDTRQDAQIANCGQGGVFQKPDKYTKLPTGTYQTLPRCSPESTRPSLQREGVALLRHGMLAAGGRLRRAAICATAAYAITAHPATMTMAAVTATNAGRSAPAINQPSTAMCIAITAPTEIAWLLRDHGIECNGP